MRRRYDRRGTRSRRKRGKERRRKRRRTRRRKERRRKMKRKRRRRRGTTIKTKGWGGVNVVLPVEREGEVFEGSEDKREDLTLRAHLIVVIDIPDRLYQNTHLTVVLSIPSPRAKRRIVPIFD